MFANYDSTQMVYDGTDIFYVDSVGKKGIKDVVIDSKGAADEKSFWSACMDSVCFGVLPGDVDSISDILKKSQISDVIPETVDGQDCDKVSFSGPYGDYQIWLNKSANWQIQKAHVEKSSSSRMYGKTLAEEFAEVKQISKAGQKQRFTADVENVKFKTINGNSVISEFDVRVQYWTGDHFWSDRVYHHRRLKVTLPSEKIAESEFTPIIPNGVAVSYLNKAAIIGDMWKDGKVVEVIDLSAVKKHEGTSNEDK